jgi:prepilin-type N-terminal cleavage/methylation domain-containing protein
MGDRDGFTLVEILIVMLMTSILVLGIQAAYQQAYRLWSQAEEDRAIWYLARTVTETLRAELGGLYIPPRNNENSEEEVEAGSAFQLDVVAGAGAELSFFTLTPAWRTDVGLSGSARVCYRFGPDPENGGTKLERLETLCAGEKLIGIPVSDVLVRGLTEFKVWAFDPNGNASPESWQESYQSEDRPPRAVRVRMRWGAEDRGNPRSRACEFESLMSVPGEGPLTPEAG